MIISLKLLSKIEKMTIVELSIFKKEFEQINFNDELLYEKRDIILQELENALLYRTLEMLGEVK